MPIIFNNTEIENVVFNGTELDKVVTDEVTVFEKNRKKTISETIYIKFADLPSYRPTSLVNVTLVFTPSYPILKDTLSIKEAWYLYKNGNYCYSLINPNVVVSEDGRNISVTGRTAGYDASMDGYREDARMNITYEYLDN